MCRCVCFTLMFACSMHVQCITQILFIVVAVLSCTLSVSTTQHVAEDCSQCVTDRHWNKLPSCCPGVTSVSLPHGCLEAGVVLYSLITIFSHLLSLFSSNHISENHSEWQKGFGCGWERLRGRIAEMLSDLRPEMLWTSVSSFPDHVGMRGAGESYAAMRMPVFVLAQGVQRDMEGCMLWLWWDNSSSL